MATTRTAFQHLRFRHLEMVRLLAETGSLRATARLMNVTPPALSKSLREVEAIVGNELFRRTPRGISATAAGSEFARHARLLLHGLDTLREAAPDLQGPARALLRIGTAPFVAWQIMPDVLRRIGDAGELPRIQLVEGRIIPLADQLLNGELDAILTVLTPEALQVLERDAFVLDQIHAERVMVVAGPQHPLARRRTTWTALAAADWILPPQTFTLRLLVQRACLQAGALPPEPVIESTNIPAVLNLAKAGLGVTTAFESTVRGDLAAGELCLVRTDAELPTVPIGLASRKASTELRTLRVLHEAIRTFSAAAP